MILRIKNDPNEIFPSTIAKNLTFCFLSNKKRLIFLENAKKSLLLLILVFGTSVAIYGQIPSAIVEFEGHSGILIPRMTTEDIASIEKPIDGLMVYDSTIGQFFFYRSISATWRSLSLDETATSSDLGSAENLQTPHQPSFGATWHVEGNIGADQYSSDPPLLGTVDEFPVVFITTDMERMRIMADGNIAIARSLDIGENLSVKQNVALNTVDGETMNHGAFTVTNQSPTILTGPLTSEQNVYLNSAGGQTINNGPFTVANQSQTLLTGKLTVDQKTLLNLGLEVYGSTVLHGLFKVDNNFASHFTGRVTISDLTQSASASVSSGALVVAGGAGIGKNLNVGGNLDINGSSAFGGPVSFASPVTISAGEESTSTTTGALIVAGGTGIGKRLNVGGATTLESTLGVSGATMLGSTLGVSGATTLNSTLGVAGATTLSNTLGVAGATTLNNTLGVTGATILNNTLGVTGATTLNNTLGVTGATTINSTLGVTGATTMGSTLAVAGNLSVNTNRFTILASNGNTAIAGTLGVTGATSLNNTLGVVGATTLSSTLGVTGATTLNSTLSVGGATTFNNILTVTANPPGGQSTFTGYPLKVQGGTQGIAIKVNGSRSNTNNFISFWDDTKMWGRIEGQRSTELDNDPEYKRIKDQLGLAVTIAAIQVATASVQLIIAGGQVIAASTSSTACAGFGACITVPIPSLIAVAAATALARTANLVAVSIGLDAAVDRRDDYDTYKSANIGVTFQSGAGDYAEWLPKANHLEKYLPGFVVGMKNGKISLNTDGADKVMVISTNPIVLGNMPEAGGESEYEKVAFMGQVPVHVLGKVTMGDYILPSGNNDGLAKAVHPTKMTADDYYKMIGMAWSTSTNDLYSQINVAIGLNDGDISKLVSEQQQEIEKLHQEIEKLHQEKSERNALLVKLVPGYKEAAGITNDAILTPNKRTISKNTDTHVEDIIEIKTSDPSTIVYFEITRDQILGGVDLAEKMFVESGGDLNTHPFWKRMQSDIAYKDGVVDEMQKKLQKTMHTHKIIDKESAHKH